MKKTTNFEPQDSEEVLNEAYLDEKILKVDAHLSLLEKDYNEFKLNYNKQSVAKSLIQKSVEMTIQILYDEDLFDSFPIADEVLSFFLVVTRRRGDLEESK